MKQLSLFETQKALLALFGFEGEQLISRLQLDMKGHDLPTLTVEKYVDLGHMPSLMTKFQRYQVRLAMLDEISDWQDQETDRPAFDLDAECKAATQRVLEHIEDRYTIHSRIVARDFAAARDHMRSRHAHQKALQAQRYVPARSFIASALSEIAHAMKGVYA